MQKKYIRVSQEEYEELCLMLAALRDRYPDDTFIATIFKKHETAIVDLILNDKDTNVYVNIASLLADDMRPAISISKSISRK